MKPEKITELDFQLLKEKYPNNLDEIIEKINNNYPVQYLIGHVDFMDTNLIVNENVLIPRFETEYLVEKVINKLKKYPDNTLKILDIGCGSGCIIINIAKNLHQYCYGIDISDKALEVAKINATRNNVSINFAKKDILNSTVEKEYDVIISNPPYIAYNESVDPTIKYEPQNALYADDNGLQFYKKILASIKHKPNLIAFEIGENQGEIILGIAKKQFLGYNIYLEKDLCGKDRYIFIEEAK